MIKYEYNKDENFIYVKRTGDTSVEEILDYINGINREYNALDKLFVLDDCTGSNAKISYNKDLQRVRDAIANISSNFKLIKVAIVVEDPSHTALNIMYEGLTHGISNYFFKVFSSVLSAEAWLRMR